MAAVFVRRGALGLGRAGGPEPAPGVRRGRGGRRRGRSAAERPGTAGRRVRAVVVVVGGSAAASAQLGEAE